jgi:hypothetical protein
LLEQRIPRCEWDAIVAAFDNEIDGGEHRLHLGEPGSMMAEEVGAWKIEL